MAMKTYKVRIPEGVSATVSELAAGEGQPVATYLQQVICDAVRGRSSAAPFFGRVAYFSPRGFASEVIGLQLDGSYESFVQVGIWSFLRDRDACARLVVRSVPAADYNRALPSSYYANLWDCGFHGGPFPSEISKYYDDGVKFLS